MSSYTAATAALGPRSRVPPPRYDPSTYASTRSTRAPRGDVSGTSTPDAGGKPQRGKKRVASRKSAGANAAPKMARNRSPRRPKPRGRASSDGAPLGSACPDDASDIPIAMLGNFSRRGGVLESAVNDSRTMANLPDTSNNVLRGVSDERTPNRKAVVDAAREAILCNTRIACALIESLNEHPHTQPMQVD